MQILVIISSQFIELELFKLCNPSLIEEILFCKFSFTKRLSFLKFLGISPILFFNNASSFVSDIDLSSVMSS